MSVLVEIPDDVVQALRLPPDDVEREVRKALAIALYARQLLPAAKARRLANMKRRDFEQLLAERQVPGAYTERDLIRDISYGRGDE